ncbi:unnamed protein product, partial [Ectocarpus fasciculatus]
TGGCAGGTRSRATSEPPGKRAPTRTGSSTSARDQKTRNAITSNGRMKNPETIQDATAEAGGAGAVAGVVVVVVVGTGDRALEGQAQDQ